jgi:DNA helicase-2/ATP-dependent DNA helicase PcrA
MAIAAALLLAERAKPPQAQGQLVLVTFTRAAVANLKNKIRQYLRELGVPSQNFWVSTLHGLALNIATRHPELSGLDLSQMTLVSPNQSHRLIRACVEQWIAAHPQQYQQLLEGRQFDGEETERLRRQSVLRTEVLPALADTVIHEAKSSGLRPADIEALSLLTERSDPALPDYNILAIAAGLFEHYEALLQARGWIDYDDMILAALRVLEHESARQVWQAQVYAVFEDEAQDSSPLQTQLLKLLAAHPIDPNQPLNLIRVGDPNQAINSTFTPADPIFFREFCQQCQNQGQLAEMDQAGRSAVVIMDAANFMLDWVNQRYPTVQPFRSQHIHPVPPDDPQANANPLPAGAGLEIRYPPDVYQSVNLIGQRVADLLTRYPDARAAVLVRENRQGKFVMDCLQQPARHSMAVDLEQLGITLYEVGAQDRHSHVPAEILALLQFLDRPHSPDNLKAALQVLVDRQLIPTQDLNALATQPEQFLYPGPLASPQPEPMAQARKYCTSLLRAYIELPLFQLIPFLALTLRYDQTELATADKLSDRITQQNRFNPSMNTVLETLREIVQSERFEPVETDEPETRYIRPKQLTIITMHKAKGLDWDFVFIPFLHDNIIPGQLWLLPQAQFLGDYTLSEVARAQIRATVHQESSVPDTLTAWERAGALKVAEEYRLLYVAMTRAKRLLWLSAARQAPFTWGKPENLDDRSPCPVLPALSQKFGKNR